MIPDHSISKGYPHDEPISQQRFPNRLNIAPDGAGLIKIPTSSAYPQFKGISWLQDALFGKATSFLRHRLFDYHEALKAAESQIMEILFDRPFLPEDFNFEKLVGPKGIHDDPVTVYKSTFNDNVTIHRDDDAGLTNYVVLVRQENGEFSEYRLNLPCQRVAYNTFFALGIKIELTEEERTIDDAMKTIFKGVGPTQEEAIELDRLIKARSGEKEKTIFKIIEEYKASLSE